MKSKNVIIGIAVVIIIILLGIIIKQNKDNAEIKQQIADIKKEMGIAEIEIDKSKELSKTEFTKYIQKVELTTENWKDYFEVIEKTREEKDQWGEIKNTTKDIYLQLKEPYYDTGELMDTTIELKVNEDKIERFENGSFVVGTTKTIEFQTGDGSSSNGGKQSIFSLSGWGDVTTKDMQCTRIKGTLYYLKDFAESNWQTDSQGKKFVNVENIIYYKNIKDYGKWLNEKPVFLKDFIEN